MAGTSEVPVARPVTSLMVGTGMLPIDSSTGPPPVTACPGGMRTTASRCPPQTGTAKGLVSEGGVAHDRTARMVTVSGPSWHGLRLVRACGKGRATEYCRPPAGIEEMSWTLTDAVPAYSKPLSPVRPERDVLLAAAGAQAARVARRLLDVDRGRELVGDGVEAHAAELLVGLVALRVDDDAEDRAEIGDVRQGRDERGGGLVRGGAERAGVAEQFRYLAEQVPGLRHLGALVEVIELPGRQLRRGPELDDLLEAGDLADRFELDGNGQAQQEVCQRAQDERRDLHGDVEAVAPHDRVGRADGRDFPGQDPADEDEVHVLAARGGEIDRNADIEVERLRTRGRPRP